MIPSTKRQSDLLSAPLSSYFFRASFIFIPWILIFNVFVWGSTSQDDLRNTSESSLSSTPKKISDDKMLEEASSNAVSKGKDPSLSITPSTSMSLQSFFNSLISKDPEVKKKFQQEQEEKDRALEKEEILHTAARTGNIDLLKEGIAKKMDVNKWGAAEANKGTPLSLASRNGIVEAVKLLLQAGAQIDNNDGDALRGAAANNKVDVARTLLIAGANSNLKKEYTCSDEETPLYLAAQKGHENIVDLLIQFRADMNIPHRNGTTPLMIAAYNGHMKVVESLVQAGAKINEVNAKGATALKAAAYFLDYAMVEYLLKNGADSDIGGEEEKTALELTMAHTWEISRGCLTPRSTRINNKLAMLKEKVIFFNTVRALAEGRTNPVPIRKRKGIMAVNITTTFGWDKDYKFETVLAPYLSIEQEDLPYYIARGQIILVKKFLEDGGEIQQKDKVGRTSLEYAIDSDQLAIAGLLIQRGALSHLIPSEIKNLLELSFKKENPEMIDLLLTSLPQQHKMAFLNDLNERGHTPLMEATGDEKNAIADILLKEGSDPNIPDKNENTALFYTVESSGDNSELIDKLVKAGAHINHRNAEGDTPLLACVKKASKENSVSALLLHGADIYAQDKKSKGVLDLSVYAPVTRLLQRHMDTNGAPTSRALSLEPLEEREEMSSQARKSNRMDDDKFLIPSIELIQKGIKQDLVTLQEYKEKAQNSTGAGDLQDAFKWWKLAAEKGDSEAQLQVAKAFEDSGIDEDEIEALVWYKQAADRGNAEARIKLGDIYFYGLLGVRRDLEKASKWYLKVQDQFLNKKT